MDIGNFELRRVGRLRNSGSVKGVNYVFDEMRERGNEGMAEV